MKKLQYQEKLEKREKSCNKKEHSSLQSFAQAIFSSDFRKKKM